VKDVRNKAAKVMVIPQPYLGIWSWKKDYKNKEGIFAMIARYKYMCTYACYCGAMKTHYGTCFFYWTSQAFFTRLSYLQAMANTFIITWQDQPIEVSVGEGEKYYDLTFRNGEKKLLENTIHGWRYVDPAVSNQDEVESELLSEESSLELGLEVEAEEIGKLISEKNVNNC
jgi:hypothetical protein